jgi:Xaa-Pro aminopeptidase
MDRPLPPLATFLDDAGTDAFLWVTDGFDPDQYYVSGFEAPDGYTSLYDADGGVHLLVSELEAGRARSSADADTVAVGSDYGSRDIAEEHGRAEASYRTLARWLDDRGVDAVSVPANFPLFDADGLRELGVTVDPAPATATGAGPVGEARATKSGTELEHLRAVQSANETAMAAAADLLAAAETDGDVLRYDGETLTSERVKEEIEVALLREGCALDETIVAGGADGAEPHNRGSGPLRPDEPVVVDIFPRDKATRYHGDMTRTFVVGEADERAREFYETTERAFEAALAALEPGVTGEAVHAAACEVYEDAGYPTLRSDPGTDTGFIHSTGHGVGLAVHEAPRLGDGADGELRDGHVVTVEPGLYDPAVGGVRIEDLVVVDGDAAEGYRNLTEYPVSMSP